MIYSALVSFCVGIVLENFFGLGWQGVLLIVIVSIICFFILHRNGGKNFIIIAFTLAFGILRMDLARVTPDQFLNEKVENHFTLVGEIVEEPDIRDTNTRYVFLPDESNSKILLTASSYPQYDYSERVSVSGKLQFPKNFQNDNGEEFDYISYLSKDNIHFVSYYPEIKLIGEEGGLASPLYSIKNAFLERISRVVPEPNSSLLGGLIVGAKQSLGQDLLDKMRTVGLIHIVVLSGYNLTIIAAAIFFLTSRLNKRNTGFLISAAAIIIFAIMVGLGATVVRASIMALVAILARFLGRPNDALRALALAAILMLLWNPFILIYDPSFQLSFMAALGLILFTPFVSEKIKFITEKFGLREIISSTLTVQIFILPLLIKMSGSISLVSFIINPIVLPFVPYVMLFGFLTGLVGFASTTLAWVPGSISYISTEAIFRIVSFANSIPLSNISIPSIPIIVIFIWYGFYVALYLKLKKKLPAIVGNFNVYES